MNKIYQYSVRRTPMDTKSQNRKARLSYFCYEHQNRVWLFGDFRCNVLLFLVILVILCLHYVPGDHGSLKRSAPWDFGQFCLGTQVLVGIITFSHGLSRYPLQTVG